MALFPVRRDAATATFFDGAARGQFLLVRDTTTGETLDPRADTAFDRARFEHVPASGEGTVVTWSVPHTRTPAGGTHRFVVGIVELAEGPWWWTELRGFDPDEDLTGARVEVRFEKSGDGEHDETVPYFTRAE